MTHYIIENNHSQSAWTVREYETGKQLGIILKKDKIYLSESQLFRAQSRAADPVLALEAVFHTAEFYQLHPGGTLHKLAPDNLRALLGASISRGSRT